jgi:hypothetical protein
MAFEVPASCTLPTVEQPVRVAEFGALFADLLRARARLDTCHLQLTFGGGEAAAARVRDLVARESACCSFFQFTVSAGHDRVLLDVVVPAARADVLDGLYEMAGECAL